MKKSLLALVLVVAIGLNLAGCSVGDNSGLGDSGAVSSGTGESSGAASSKPEEKRLNLDVLSDLGLTFEQIREKRGELVGAHTGPQVCSSYIFERGFGSYGWLSSDIDWQTTAEGKFIPLPGLDDEGNWNYKEGPFPKPQAKCQVIIPKNIRDVFFGISETAKDDQFADSYRLKCVLSGWNDLDMCYTSLFEYENILIRINTAEEGIITKDSKVNSILFKE